MIESVFDDDDAKLILGIPLGRRSRSDMLLWHFDAKGCFTVKSAYKLAAQGVHGTGSSSSAPNESYVEFWKKVWRAKVPGKVKVHVWKACRAILPTVSRLLSRRIVLDQGCFFCDDPSETIEHVCRDCPFSKAFLLHFSELRASLSATPSSVSFLFWLVSCSETLSPVSFAFLLFALWSLWKERNQRAWQNKFLTLEHLCFNTRSQFSLFVSTRFPLSPPRLAKVFTSWNPPSIGWLKGNADGAFDVASNSGGIGVVIRNHHGEVLGGVCMRVLHVSTAEMVEALAARAACELAISFSLSPIKFEVDSLLVVQATTSTVPTSSVHGCIYEDISDYILQLPGASFSHVMRSSNGEAHRLAKLALRANLNVSWFGSAPPDIRGLVSTFCIR